MEVTHISARHTCHFLSLAHITTYRLFVTVEVSLFYTQNHLPPLCCCGSFSLTHITTYSLFVIVEVSLFYTQNHLPPLCRCGRGHPRGGRRRRVATGSQCSQTASAQRAHSTVGLGPSKQDFLWSWFKHTHTHNTHIEAVNSANSSL